MANRRAGRRQDVRNRDQQRGQDGETGLKYAEHIDTLQAAHRTLCEAIDRSRKGLSSVPACMAAGELVDAVIASMQDVHVMLLQRQVDDLAAQLNPKQ